jgi:N-methylhydantoinase A/oxoprolinase/acetone carboxylase beta subunit
MTVSTTLGLNSVLTGGAAPVGVILTSGPGLDLELDPAVYGGLVRTVRGSQDHRGQVLEPLDERGVREAAASFGKAGAGALVVASKFGPKNQELEGALARAAAESFRGTVMRASSLFGGLNFKRRLNSAYLNAMVHGTYRTFLSDLERALSEQGLAFEVWVLKSDGGVMDLPEARRLPALALAAGPAASLLGLWHIAGAGGGDPAPDVLMADVGGTSTDLALLSRGEPLLEPEGLRIAGLDTLIRGLLTRSLALGGDTDLAYEAGAFRPLPQRRGPALSLDPGNARKRPPTLTDATNVLGLSAVGDTAVSLAAFRALDPGADPKALAGLAAGAVLERLGLAAGDFLSEVNRRPAYTISELLLGERVSPSGAVILGGPAGSLAGLAGPALGIPASVPKEAPYANALGAALARPTRSAELYADTALGLMSIPVLGIQRGIPRGYGLKDAEADLISAMGGAADLRVTQAECFSQLGEGEDEGSGKVMRVRAQTAPGLVGPKGGPRG